MAEDKNARRAVVMSTASAALSLATLLKGTPVQAAEEFPPELLELLRAIALGMSASLEQMEAILNALNNLKVQGYPPNADYETTVRVNCQVANQAYQVPSLIVPDGFSVLIKAWPLNAVGSLIYEVTSPAPNVNMAYALVPNETRTINIKDTGKITLFSNVAGSQATVSAEQRSI